MTSSTPSAHADCAAACAACADACDQCLAGCLGEPGVAAMARCIALDVDCAALCRLALGALRRASPLAGTICAACAQACDACAEECGRHAHRHCQDCARACRACAQACRAMAA